MGRRKTGRAVSGWVNLDKPLNLGSTPAVSGVRRLFQAQKAGHAGTLDPLASGILPIALGEATKIIHFMQDAQKIYDIKTVFGHETTTDDLEGRITESSDLRPDAAALSQALPHFTGLVTQVPPQFSAIKQDGARAYALARAGETVDLAPRQVRIDAIELLGQDENGAFDLRVTCGKGVYMRALARDLGRHLGGRAHIGGLRRVAVGPFHEKNAIGLEKLSALGHIADDLAALDACLLPLSTALDDIPALAVTAEQASRIKQGQAISLHSLDFVYEQSGPCLATLDNQPVAICETGQDRLRVLRVFNL